MQHFIDYRKRSIRLTAERRNHIESAHPEMSRQIENIAETIEEPQNVVRSRTDNTVELLYRLYEATPVTTKYLCVVIKAQVNDPFIITAYFTDTIKKGEVLWTKK